MSLGNEFLGGKDPDLEEAKRILYDTFESGEYDIAASQESVGKIVMCKNDLNMSLYSVLKIDGEQALCIDENDNSIYIPLGDLVDANLLLKKIQEILTKIDYQRATRDAFLSKYSSPN